MNPAKPRHRTLASSPVSFSMGRRPALALAGVLLAVTGTMLGTRAPAEPNPRGPQPRTVSNARTEKPFDTSVIGSLPITELTEDQAVQHALNRLGYGPTPGEIAYVKKIGLQTWIDRQLHPETIDDSALDARLAKLPTLSMSSEQLLAKFPPPKLAAPKAGQTLPQYQQQMKEKRHSAMQRFLKDEVPSRKRADQMLARIQGPNRIVAELSMAKMERAVYSQRQLEAVMEDFWFNHFNVFAAKGLDRWLLTSYVRDTIRPHTMGKFQDLLLATAHSPAMLFYLDNWRSVDPTVFERRQRRIAARRARFQSRFPGLFPQAPEMQVRPNGQTPWPQTAAGRKLRELGINENYGREVMELHTVGVDAGYTQQDVIEMAKCLTGWSIRTPRRDPEFTFRPAFHAEGPKRVMNHTIDAGGEQDGIEALEMLANDPHTARRISMELARHFVSDDPPPALVDRMTKEYEASGGDIRGVLRTMIFSPEFWSRKAYRAKVKTPFELVASTARALDADVSVALPMVQWAARMGEPLFLCQPPNGYSDQSETWVNSGALLNRLNFAVAIATNHVPGTQVDLGAWLGPNASSDPRAALRRALRLYLDNQVAPRTRAVLEDRLHDLRIVPTRFHDPVGRVNEGLLTGWVLGTPEFQQR